MVSRPFCSTLLCPRRSSVVLRTCPAQCQTCTFFHKHRNMEWPSSCSLLTGVWPQDSPLTVGDLSTGQHLEDGTLFVCTLRDLTAPQDSVGGVKWPVLTEPAPCRVVRGARTCCVWSVWQQRPRYYTCCNYAGEDPRLEQSSLVTCLKSDFSSLVTYPKSDGK